MSTLAKSGVQKHHKLVPYLLRPWTTGVKGQLFGLQQETHDTLLISCYENLYATRYAHEGKQDKIAIAFPYFTIF